MGKTIKNMKQLGTNGEKPWNYSLFLRGEVNVMVFFDDFSGGTCGKRRNHTHLGEIIGHHLGKLYQENPQWPSYFRILVTKWEYIFSVFSVLFFHFLRRIIPQFIVISGLWFGTFFINPYIYIYIYILGIIIPTDSYFSEG